MKKRRTIYQDDAETVIVIGEPQAPSRARRVFGFLLTLVLMAVVNLIGVLLFLIPGINGLMTERLRTFSKMRGGSKLLHGAEAVTWSWSHLGMAFLIFVIVSWTARDQMAEYHRVIQLIHWVIFWLLGLAMVICFGIWLQRLAHGG